MNERLGIVGGGTIACGLAATAAQHGDVILWARSPDKALKILEKACGKVNVDPEKVTVSPDLDALGDATMVVEAIAEDLDAKRELYDNLPVENGTLLATTTS